MAQTARDPESFLPLTPAEFYIMLALTGGTLHGYAMMQLSEEQSGGRLKLGPGTLYSTIKRLLERGLIEEAVEPDSGDPRRKYYRLTGLGERVVRAESERLAQAVSIARRMGLLGDRT